MTIKTITVTEDAYNAIKKMKLGDESFSDLFLRIGEGNLKIKDLIGALKLPRMRTPSKEQRPRQP